MKILFIAHNGHPYGANKSLLTVIEHLKKTNDVLLITPRKNHFIDSKSSVSNINFPFFSTLFYVKFKPKYIVFPFLLVLNVLIFPFLLYRIAKFNPDLIYSNTSVENIGLICAKILKKKHITHVREFGNLDYGLQCILGVKFKRYLLNKSDGLIFNSQIVCETVLPVQYQTTKCKVVYNGIRVKENIQYRQFPEERNIITFGIVGFIHEHKGQLQAVEYIADFLKKYNCRLFIYGDGEKEYVKKIQDFIHSKDLMENVFLKGYSSNADKIYSSIDVLLMFSQNEAFGRVTIEAMQNGIPVVAYKGGGTMELIENKVDGLLFETKSEFQNCISSLVFDSSLYESISKKAINKVRNCFSEENYINDVGIFVNDILNL